ncbi:unnamed protein product [Linum tenue]|uniref:RNase H type-1 domain-containing protein n=1 Tax=Linum tenue TaxID=586396 RepID=A0AAV0LYI4_9ROSI|nr:unnamed protein product [Linum tenue]
MIEVDSLTLTEKIEQAEEVQTETGVICRRIVRLLQDQTPTPGCIKHVRRAANVCAHILAHNGTSWDSREVWCDNPPLFLVDQLRLDNVTFTPN